MILETILGHLDKDGIMEFYYNPVICILVLFGSSMTCFFPLYDQKI